MLSQGRKKSEIPNVFGDNYQIQPICRVKDGKEHAKEADQGNVADIEDEFFVPHFQRISATGEDNTGVIHTKETNKYL